MPWLNPEKISPSEYDPQKSVDAFIGQYGKVGETVLDCFNGVDPLHVFFEDNVDEYIGYAEKFMKALGNRKFEHLTAEEIGELVRGSFHKDQIGKFASEREIEQLISHLYFSREPNPPENYPEKSS